MAGKQFLNKILLITMALVLLLPSLGACKQKKHIAVLLSTGEQAYFNPLKSFSEEVDREVRVFNLHGDIRRDPSLKNQIFADRPVLIFALGAKAAYAAKLWTREQQDIPVIFAMVYNWQKYNLLNGQVNMAGISSEIAPSVQFLNLSMFVPAARRVGVIYNPVHSAQLVAQARKAAAILGLELVERQINSPNKFRRIYRQLLRQVDGLWLLNDPSTYTLDNMDWVKDRCVKDRLVCIGQSPNLAEMGMMLSVLPDMTSVGIQAASMAKNILTQDQQPMVMGVMEPLGTRILVNQRTAERIGIHLSSQALGLATEVVE